jgi:SAM-dependent methyltransferase
MQDLQLPRRLVTVGRRFGSVSMRARRRCVVTDEVPDCALCGGTGQRTLLTGVADERCGTAGLWEIVGCAACGLAFLSPRPDTESIGRYYPPGVVEHPGLAQGFADAEADIVARLRPVVGTVLDVGCASGGFMSAMSARGWTVCGIEPRESAAQLASALGRVHAGGIETAPFEPGTFDVVTFWSVLEHVHEPVGALRQASRLLKPGGVVVLLVPNFGGIERRVFRRHFFGLDVPRHLYHFTPRTIHRAADRAGLRVESIDHASGHDSFRHSLLGALGRLPPGGTGTLGPDGPSDAHTPSARQRLRGAIVHYTLTLVDRLQLGSQMIVVASRRAPDDILGAGREPGD